MTTAVAQPVVEKQAFRNDSPGWIGVTILGPEGHPKGSPVEPGGIVWLSEQEQILTANAPRRAEDNPFIEHKMYFGVDGEGNPVERTCTPLTPVSENRYVPAGARPIPARDMAAQPTAEELQAEADEPTTPPAPAPNPTPAPAPPPPPVPPRAAASAAAEEEPPSEETAVAATPPDEHIETGAAVPPSQDAPEGEYAAKEEVGTPSAPATAPAPYAPPVGG